MLCKCNNGESIDYVPNVDNVDNAKEPNVKCYLIIRFHVDKLSSAHVYLRMPKVSVSDLYIKFH